MDTSGQPQTLTGPQTIVLGAFVLLTLAASSAALWGNAEQSERGFRLLNWLDNRRKTKTSPAESGL
ncbi:hypothetical protein GCM10010260_83790 [Streptomyces filipinensis]|uniref:Uncharacterized protein n=1 Tax=Streptomyces filipinensis TaxID=66887 RepID=A0A918MGL1_9ACTN|nr:hypothetical protein [Streptomyces filipinensis]GGV30518.1 hypothetical protein GCM10010260_83790 [Streptomyces filipinensis]